MSNGLIRTLFEKRLKTWADVNDYPVAFEDQPFTIPETTYLRLFLLPAFTTSDDLKGDHRAYSGIVQIDILCPRDKGPGEGERVLKSLETLFPVNLRLTSGTFSVMTVSPLSAGPTLPDSTRRHLPTSLRYRADTI